MGQEQSSIGGAADGFDADLHANQQYPSNRSSQSSQVKPEEDEKIDIYDTSVNKALLDLLATIHDEDETLPWNMASQDAKAAMSATAQEFVPGKIFDASRTKATPSIVPPIVPVVPKSSFETAQAAAEKLNAAAPEFVPGKIGSSSSGTPSLSTPVVEASLRKTSAISPEKKVWYYKDPSGTVRGAFSTTDMRVWSEKNYFNDSLEVAREEKGPFISLGEVYQKEAFFSRVMDTKEFMTKVQAVNTRKQQAIQQQLQRQLQEQLEKKGAGNLFQTKLRSSSDNLNVELEPLRPRRDSADSSNSNSSPKKSKTRK